MGIYRLCLCYSTAVRELPPKKEHEFRHASSLHISYLVPLALCSEQAGLSPSQYELPCSPTEFHQSPGHLRRDKVKWHCVSVRHSCDWAKTFSASFLALTQLACVTPTAQLGNSPLEPHNASQVSRLRQPRALGAQCAAMQLCSAWWYLVSSTGKLQTHCKWLADSHSHWASKDFSKGRQHWWQQLCLLKFLEKAGTNFGQEPRESF